VVLPSSVTRTARRAWLAAAALVAACGGDADLRVPARIRLDREVADLSAAFGPHAVARGAGVERASLAPSAEYRNVEGAHRPALVAPPPAVLRFTVDAPPAATLVFGVGVERAAGAGEAGVRFAVRVDGREAWAREVNPKARRDRRWFDVRVPLGLDRPRPVTIELATTVAGEGAPVGRAGWSGVRVVEERRRDRQPAGRGTPNVLVLLVDTLRADALGVYGARPSPSPTLDALAARSLVFDRMIAQASWTMPATASLLTGLPPAGHGVQGAFDPTGVMRDDDTDASFLPNALETFAERALDAGVTTVGVSANALVSRATHFSQGFETFVEFGMEERFARDGEERNWAGAEVLNDTFLRWLAANRAHRFLAYLHYMDPHDPYTPPADLRPPLPAGVRPELAAGRIDGVAREVNEGARPPLAAVDAEWLHALYRAEVRAWDRAFARLLEGLDRLGVRESTVVVVTADHGEEFQEHGRLKHRVQLYEESVHVPFVVHGPGVTPGRVAGVVQQLDVFPTVAALLGLPPRTDLSGHDLLASRAVRPALSETRYGRARNGVQTELVALTTARWKLIQAPALGTAELYDLVADPGERRDVWSDAAEGPALAAELHALRAAAPAPPRAEGRDPGLADKLRALGYVQ